MENSVSLKFRGAQIWNKLPNVFKIIKHCTPFKKCAEAYAVFCIHYFSNMKQNRRKKILDNVFQSNCSSHPKIQTNPSKIENGVKFDIGRLFSQPYVGKTDWQNFIVSSTVLLCSTGFSN